MYASSAYSIGKSKKCEMDKTTQLTSPGPGTYNASKTARNRLPTWRLVHKFKN